MSILSKIIILSTFAFTAFSAPQVKPGSFLVKRKSTASISALSAVHAKAGARSVKRFKYPAGLELVEVRPGASSAQALEVYENDPSVEYVEPNYIVHAFAQPDDTYFWYQWGFHNIGQAVWRSTEGYYDSDINAPEAWSLGVDTSNTVVGIIDTGIDYTHPDLKNNLWVNSQEIAGNGLDDDHNGYVDDIYGINSIRNNGDPWDDNIHGTHVAGVIGAEGNDAYGVTGVMQKAKIISCKFLDSNGSGDTASAIACMDYFSALARREEDPVQIVATNNSWGGGGYSRAFAEAVRDHQGLGILFFAAASNEGSNNDVYSVFPAAIRHSNVVSVAAFNNKDQRAKFSNYGKHTVHVAAPGVDILSTIPNRYYKYLNGTSMATPFVTGLAGFLKAQDPSRDWIQIKNLIISGGTPVRTAKNTTISGRRIRMWDDNGQGSASCYEQRVTARLLPKSDEIRMRVGQKLVLSLLKINCDKSTQPVMDITEDEIPAGKLNDLGLNGDDLAYDGVFHGYFEPSSAGEYWLQFPSEDWVFVKVDW